MPEPTERPLRHLREVHELAKEVTALQAEHDGMNHNTTGYSFMLEHGDGWEHERAMIMSEINARRTQAIWALDRLLR
jgi:hypothetical protein